MLVPEVAALGEAAHVEDLAAVLEQEPRALIREGPRAGPADSRACARDDGDFALQFKVHGHLPGRVDETFMGRPALASPRPLGALPAPSRASTEFQHAA